MSARPLIGCYDAKSWNEYISQEKPVLAYFYSPWSAPSRNAFPKVYKFAKELAEDGRYTFLRVDMDDLRSIAKGCGVETLPTIMLKNGDKIDLFTGDLMVDNLKKATETLRNGPKGMN